MDPMMFTLARSAWNVVTGNHSKPPAMGGMTGIVSTEKMREVRTRVRENAKTLDHMIDATDLQKKLLTGALSNVPPAMLHKIDEAGVHIGVVRKGVFSNGNTVGAYSSEEKLLVVREDELQGGTPVHELGHAYDDALAPDAQVNGKRETRFRSDQADFQKIFKNYQKNTQGQLPAGQEWAPANDFEPTKGKMWSPYARRNAHEYFAEGVEHYLNPFKQAELRATDPELSQFLAQTLH